MMDKERISLLHRILAIKQARALSGSKNKESYLGVCCALAAIVEDSVDLDYYSFSRQYLQSLIAFAKKDYDGIQSLDTYDSKDMGILEKRTMAKVLKEYDNPEESDVLTQVISELQDTELSDVAKLVQASNRFIGSTSLERLRDDLHRLQEPIHLQRFFGRAAVDVAVYRDIRDVDSLTAPIVVRVAR